MSLLNWVMIGVLISNFTAIITIMTFLIIIMIEIVDCANIMLCDIIIMIIMITIIIMIIIIMIIIVIISCCWERHHDWNFRHYCTERLDCTVRKVSFEPV